MDIGIFGAIVFVALTVWLPLVAVFLFLAYAFAHKFSGNRNEKLSKSMFWAGIIFIPS